MYEAYSKIRIWNIVEIIPILLEMHIVMWCKWSFKVKVSSIRTPQNLDLVFFSSSISSILIYIGVSVLWEWCLEYMKWVFFLY